MDSLRWVLLLIGVGIVFLIYLMGRKKNISSVQGDEIQVFDADAPENLDIQVLDKKVLDQIDFNALASGMKLNNESSDTRTAKESTRPDNNKQKTETDSDTDDDRLIVFYLVRKDNSVMKGKQLVGALEKAGLRYGDMKIFHFHDMDDNKKVLFSVANLTDPGWFDLIAIDSLETPGLSLFMRLPESGSTIASFDCFVAVIEKLKKELSAVLKDRKHNTVSPQILGHMRENMVEYERKQKIKSKPE